jgi:hypothetical protein
VNGEGCRAQPSTTSVAGAGVHAAKAIESARRMVLFLQLWAASSV